MQNPELELAYNFVEYTNRNIFLTGKAGTGKTTFLHNLKKTSLKRMVVVAPTGVAAINAGGATIHSFFQLPFGPYLSQGVTGSRIPGPGRQLRHQRFSQDKINLLRSIDLLVIDEISMVRADTLDGIDDVLRRYRDRNKAFGGTQVLMIGDLHQLAPVVKEEDWRILRDFYGSLYFFSSHVLRQVPTINIELKHIYRQSDSEFIALLNTIRENQTGPATLEKLNTRYVPGFQPDDNEGYITLTTHNHTANAINHTQLEELTAKQRQFRAAVKGDFPEYAYPAAETLTLKTGAQVMFVKNDPSRDKLFYNGKIGRVTGFDNDSVFVKCPGDEDTIEVSPAEWKNVSYSLNEQNEVEESVAGTFVQYPLKLAWAITIHKSQGLTFERAIIDAAASFAHGQVYVALSRCKSLEGVTLRSPISPNSVKTDGMVVDYSRNMEANIPDTGQLLHSMISFQQSLIYELFDFTEAKIRFFALLSLAQHHDHSLPPSLLENLNSLKDTAERDVYAVADSFRKQLTGLFGSNSLPEKDESIQERLKKASAWFTEKIEEGVYIPVSNLAIDSDNREAKKSLAKALDNFRKEIFIRMSCISACKEKFETTSALKARANAELDYQKASKLHKRQTVATDKNAHPDLYASLKKWRDGLAEENNIPAHMILPIKSMTEIVTFLPSSRKELAGISRMGKKKLEKYGDELLRILAGYRRSAD
jgi:hypothetical protein